MLYSGLCFCHTFSIVYWAGAGGTASLKVMQKGLQNKYFV
jgi:hypothetical protein